MDTDMHKTMVSIVSLEKIEIIRSQEFMPSKAQLKFLEKMIILGPKTGILGLNFVEFWCWGLIFGGQGGLSSWGLPLDPPLHHNKEFQLSLKTEFIVSYMVSESFEPTRWEGKQSNKCSTVTKKKVVHMQPETQSRDSEAVCIQSKIQARN